MIPFKCFSQRVGKEFSPFLSSMYGVIWTQWEDSRSTDTTDGKRTNSLFGLISKSESEALSDIRSSLYSILIFPPAGPPFPTGVFLFKLEKKDTGRSQDISCSRCRRHETSRRKNAWAINGVSLLKQIFFDYFTKNQLGLTTWVVLATEVMVTGRILLNISLFQDYVIAISTFFAWTSAFAVIVPSTTEGGAAPTGGGVPDGSKSASAQSP